ncbi:DUF1573 domain-containing protein [Desulfatirhabdium butyrativorans]|uniref:DUF1573 domain-containing protein n=1 Tax=Desulfatirhabdium butyrativorans TaxID=340467 RepID=UPI00048191CC|nr:DUF1573 domain-containing protein [Desulfatirhabdium butyrativorans]
MSVLKICRRRFILLFLIGFLGLYFSAGNAFAEDLVVPEKVFLFDTVVEGTPVVHGFIVKNKGKAPVQLLRVRTDCGCSAVTHPPAIAAGGAETITIKLDTNGYGGQRITKTATIETSSVEVPSVALTLIGQVDIFARVEPQRLSLRGKAGEALSGKVRIVRLPQYPFRIVETRARTGSDIAFQLAETAGGYELDVKAIRNQPGRAFDTILMKTDSPVKPELQVSVYLQILDPNAKPASEMRLIPISPESKTQADPS